MSRWNDGRDEESPFILESKTESKHSKPRGSRTFDFRFASIVPWALVLVLSTILAVISFRTNKGRQLRVWSTTDFAPARSAITTTKIKFSSSLDFADPDHIYRIFDLEDPVYVGNRTAEIDEAWDRIILPADIYITDEEAMSVGGELTKQTDKRKFKIELEVFHSLHCLNMIRKRIYLSQYPEMESHNAQTHVVDHCIETLRELIMCGGNMTPIPLEWSEKGHRINPNYATVHECRDFEVLKQWAIERDGRSV